MPNDVVRLRGHPLHASMVHVPIGLMAVAPLWDVVGLATGVSTWWAIGFWTVLVGVGLALVAAVVGLTDLVRAVEGPARAVGIRHMIGNVAAVVAYAAGLVVRGGPALPSGHGAIVLICDVVGLVSVAGAGWL